MLKQQAKLLTKIAMLTDCGMICAAFIAAYHLCSRFTHLSYIHHYTWLLFIVLPSSLYLLAHFNLYASLRTRRPSEVVVDLIKVTMLLAVMASSLIYLIEPNGFSRIFFGTFFVLSLLFISTGKLTIKGILSYFRRRGYNFRNILIVGINARTGELISLIRDHVQWGLNIVGLVALEDDRGQEEFSGVPILGSINEIVDICIAQPIDEVIWCRVVTAQERAEGFFQTLSEMGITLRAVIDYIDLPRTRAELSLFHGRLPMMTFYPKAFDAEQLLIKRCLDIVGSSIGLVLSSLLFPFISLAIRLDSPGPVVFSQTRVGENGRLFRCLKFRTMYLDAEERKKDLLLQNEMKGAIFKMRNDPRVTRVGAFLRKTSLDELPQFWNVLRGEMSLVGTRPPTPDEVASYETWHRKRISVRPGLTGLWQVSGRNHIQDFDDIVRLDLEYIENWSLWFDLKLIFKTCWVVLVRTGSC